MRETETDRDRQTDRQTNRQTETDIQTETKTGERESVCTCVRVPFNTSEKV